MRKLFFNVHFSLHLSWGLRPSHPPKPTPEGSDQLPGRGRPSRRGHFTRRLSRHHQPCWQAPRHWFL